MEHPFKSEQLIAVDIFSTNGYFNPCGITAERVLVPCKDGNSREDISDHPNSVILDLIERKGGVRPQFQKRGEHRQLAFGGRFIWSSDSRFRKQYGDNPIPLHDNYVS